MKIAKNMAVADAGVTGHFVLPGTPVTNAKVARHPLKINLRDGDFLRSTHTFTLDIPWLPNDAKEAHIVPGLAHAYLIYIKILCDAGCKVIYDDNECRVFYNKKWCGSENENLKQVYEYYRSPTPPDDHTQQLLTAITI